MSPEGLKIRWSVEMGAGERRIRTYKFMKKSPLPREEWKPWCGLIPCSLFHIPSPGLAGLTAVMETSQPYAKHCDPLLEKRVLERHLEPLFVAAPLSLTRDWETRARDFLPDHMQRDWGRIFTVYLPCDILFGAMRDASVCRVHTESREAWGVEPERA